MEENLRGIFESARDLRAKVSTTYPLLSDREYPLSVAYFWPTKYCPIGCDHCMFASPKPKYIDKSKVLNDTAIEKFIQMSKEAKLKSLVLSGGGEPMMEMPIILKLISEAEYEYFEIITGGHWLASKRLVQTTLGSLQQAIFNRRNRGHDFDFSLRLSLDSYHQTVVKLPWVKRLVDILRDDAILPELERRYPDINLFFRTILIEDDTVYNLAALLDAELTDMKDYIRELKFNDDKSSSINTLQAFYKDMRFVGRGEGLNTVKLMGFDEYFASYSDDHQDIRLGMTYFKPGSRAQALEGINVIVTYEGKMMPYGGAPDVSINIYLEKYQDLLIKLSKDVISRTLLFEGLDHVRKIAEEVDPDIMDRIRRKNWVASVADESLSTAEKRLYISIRLLQIKIENGEIKLDQLPEHVRELVSIDPEVLQAEYHRHMNSIGYIQHDFGNEVVSVMEKFSTNISSFEKLSQ